MKLNIAFNKTLSGYINIDIAQQPVDLGNLDEVCGPSECREIIVDNVLDYIPFNSLETVIQHLCSKIRHKGRMVILFNDVNSIIRKYNMAEITEEELNNTLFGHGQRSSFSYYYISDILSKTDLSIASIDIEDGQVTMVAERK